MLLPFFAQEAPASALSLDGAVQEALTNHRRLAAARQDAVAAQFAARAAHARVGPDILFAPALDQANGTTEELLVTQPLEINGTRAARSASARALLRAAQADVETQRAAVVAEVQSAYIALWRERETLALARTLAETARTVHALARKQVELGSRPGIDLAQTGLEEARARQQAALASSRVRQAEAALNAALGRREDAPAPSVALPDTPQASPEPAAIDRPEVRAEAARTDALRHDAALVRAEGRPDLAPQFRSQVVTFQTPRRSDYGFSVAVRVPIDWGARRDRVRQADAVVQAQEDRVAAMRRTVSQEVVQARARLEGAVAALAALDDALPLAQRLLQASQIGFEEGKTSALAVLEAQRAYRTALSEHVAARAERALAQAELARVRGGVR